jgi:hypothetical protein
MVVGVSPPFDFRCYLAAVVGARQQASISKFMGIVSGLIVATENGLDLLEAFHRNKGRMSAGVLLSLPQEYALVKRILKDPIYITLAQIDSEFIRNRYP